MLFDAWSNYLLNVSVSNSSTQCLQQSMAYEIHNLSISQTIGKMDWMCIYYDGIKYECANMTLENLFLAIIIIHILYFIRYFFVLRCKRHTAFDCSEKKSVRKRSSSFRWSWCIVSFYFAFSHCSMYQRLLCVGLIYAPLAKWIRRKEESLTKTMLWHFSYICKRFLLDILFMVFNIRKHYLMPFIIHT